jgi:hypothetical protein
MCSGELGPDLRREQLVSVRWLAGLGCVTREANWWLQRNVQRCLANTERVSALAGKAKRENSCDLSAWEIMRNTSNDRGNDGEDTLPHLDAKQHLLVGETRLPRSATDSLAMGGAESLPLQVCGELTGHLGFFHA